MSEANIPFNPQGQSESVDSIAEASSSSPLGAAPQSGVINDNHSDNHSDGAGDATKGSSTEAANFGANQIGANPVSSIFDASGIFDASELDAALEELNEALTASAITAQAQPTQDQPNQGHPTQDQPTPDQLTPEQPAAAHPVSTNLSAIAAWSQEALSQEALSQEALSQDTFSQTEIPNMTDLIALIQELNQCNGALMERVTQLEEALEDSQTALQAEVGLTQLNQYSTQDWTAVQEQITTLFNQLEFAHQANQRQQILIETLTGQLESSQERVAQLERESALIQQRYNEQTQLLAKSESDCRDLQSRLQRQQRYTLQFKAALEKCLEVPTPQYETAAAGTTEAFAAAPFLPKAQQIRPWSAQSYGSDNSPGSDKSPWMKVQRIDFSLEAETEADLESNPAAAPAAQTTHLNLPSFGLPLLQVAETENQSDLSDDSIYADSLNHLAQLPQQLSNDPMLRQQLDAAVKPLADMLAEALLSEAPIDPAAHHGNDHSDDYRSQPSQPQLSQPQPSQPQPSQPQPSLTHPDSPSAAASTQPAPVASETAELDDPWNSRSADELLAATMADAEDALWQDLARLIDVSTEDVVKASLSGDLAAFESIDFAAIPPSQAETLSPDAPAPSSPQPKPGKPASAQPAQPASAKSSQVKPSQVKPSQVKPSQKAASEAVAEDAVREGALREGAIREDAITIAPLVRRLGQAAASQATTQSAAAEIDSAANEAELIPALANSSWPSPVVYPLRPTKKRNSLAMVDLPSFPKS